MAGFISVSSYLTGFVPVNCAVNRDKCEIAGISAANLRGFECIRRIRVNLTGESPVNVVNRVSEDKLAGYFHVKCS